MRKIAFAAIALIVGLTAAEAREDRRIRIHNNTGKRIVELYGSPIDDPNYHYNMIRGPSQWIRAGETRLADIDDGTGYCRYDLKAVDAAGNVAERLNANVCELTDWYIYD